VLDAVIVWTQRRPRTSFFTTKIARKPLRSLASRAPASQPPRAPDPYGSAEPDAGRGHRPARFTCCTIMTLAAPEDAERIILLEADTAKPFGLNLLAVRSPVDETDDPVTWLWTARLRQLKRCTTR